MINRIENDADLLKIGIEEATKRYGVTGYLKYKKLMNPEITKMNYLEIRKELFKDLTFEMLYECLKNKNHPNVSNM